MSRFDELSQQIMEHPQLANARSWYDALPSRDQMVVKAVSVLVMVALIFVVVYAPLMRTNQSLQTGLEKKIAVYDLIAENAGRFGSVSTVVSTDGPILSRITQSARKSGIKLDRYEQDGKGVRIWMDKIKFDRFITWIEVLGTQHSIYVNQITVDRDESTGWVDVRATLVPG